MFKDIRFKKVVNVYLKIFILIPNIIQFLDLYFQTNQKTLNSFVGYLNYRVNLLKIFELNDNCYTCNRIGRSLFPSDVSSVDLYCNPCINNTLYCLEIQASVGCRFYHRWYLWYGKFNRADISETKYINQ